jgi:L-amino acid N-acyltransferase YncA
MEFSTITDKNFSQAQEIYSQGLATNTATFQNDSPQWEEWDTSHLPFCRISIVQDGIMKGWTALTPVSGRCAYAGVAEVSIYIAADQRGKGIGSILMKELIGQSEKHGIWTLQSSIFSENAGSIKLHEKCGFRLVGFREKIGKKNGVWKDNVIMERRSSIIGID